MTDRHPFYDPATHGFVRVGTATPAVAVADPERNADAVIALGREADAEHVDLVVFPELCVSSYAVDDIHLQDAFLRAVDAAVGRIVDASADMRPVLLVGAPIAGNGRLYNCAVVIAHGRVLGVVPKSFLPNYREYYEKRWFAPGAGIVGAEITVAGATVPFGTDLRFAATDHDGFDFCAEVCEDVWAPTPPSTTGALAGALILANLSASNIVIGKARDRMLLCAAQSHAHVQRLRVLGRRARREHHRPGVGRAGNGPRAGRAPRAVGALRHRARAGGGRRGCRPASVSSGCARARSTMPPSPAAGPRAAPAWSRSTIGRTAGAPEALCRPVARFPFVPDDPERLDDDCYEAFNIQVEGLSPGSGPPGASTPSSACPAGSTPPMP